MKTNLLVNSMNRAGKALCALCVVAMAAAFTGCEYDDSDLNNRIDNLEQRIDKLEKDMTSQIEALQQMLNGKLTIASSTYDKAKGVYTIVLSNGEELIVAAAGEGSSLISVMKDGDAYYWTLNGEPMTDGEGNKLPVAVAPGVRVNNATNEWEVSPDGGKTWLGTGITAEEGTSLFAKVEQDDAYVYFTLGDGTQVKVARTTDFRCTVLAGKQYFANDQVRRIKLDMSDVKKSTVTKPDGWKAVVENSELKITAPAADNSYAEKSGKVAVVAVASNGESSISEVNVAMGTAPHEITIDPDMNVQITVDPKLVDDYSYDGFYYGVKKFSEFSPEKVIEEIKSNTFAYPGIDEVNSTLAEILGTDPEPGVSYVIYAVDQYSNRLDNPEDMMYGVAQSIFTKIEISDVLYDDANLSVEAMGVSKCWAGVAPTADYNPATILTDIKDGYASEKVAAKYTGALSEYAGGTRLQAGTEYTVWVLPYAPEKAYSAYTADNFFTQKVTIAPLTLDGSASVEIGEVTSTMKTVSALITPGTGVYKYYSKYMSEMDIASVRDEELIKSLINSGVATKAPATYEIEQIGLKPETKGYFLSVAVTKDGQAGPLVKKDATTLPLTFSTEVITAEATSIGLDAVTIKITGSPEIESYRYYNNTKTWWENDFTYLGNETTTENELALAVEGENWSVTFIQASENEISLSWLESGSEYVFFVVGIDKNGTPTKMAKVEYAPSISKEVFVAKDSDLWNANYDQRPQFSNVVAKKHTIISENGNESDWLKVTADISVGEKCDKYWILATAPDDNPTSGTVGGRLQTTKVLARGDKQELTGNQTELLLTEFGSLDPEVGVLVLVVWQDKDGKVYQYESYLYFEQKQ